MKRTMLLVSILLLVVSIPAWGQENVTVARTLPKATIENATVDEWKYGKYVTGWSLPRESFSAATGLGIEVSTSEIDGLRKAVEKWHARHPSSGDTAEVRVCLNSDCKKFTFEDFFSRLELRVSPETDTTGGATYLSDTYGLPSSFTIDRYLKVNRTGVITFGATPYHKPLRRHRARRHYAHAQQPKEVAAATPKQDTPLVADKPALKLRTEQLNQTRMGAEYQTLQTRIKELQDKFAESQKNYQAAVDEAYTGVDRKAWVLDPETLTFKPIPKTEAAQVPAKPNDKKP